MPKPKDTGWRDHRFGTLPRHPAYQPRKEGPPMVRPKALSVAFAGGLAGTALARAHAGSHAVRGEFTA